MSLNNKQNIKQTIGKELEIRTIKFSENQIKIKFKKWATMTS